MSNLTTEVLKCLNEGIKKNGDIQTKIQERTGKSYSINSISSIKSTLKSSRSMDNSNTNSTPNDDNPTPNINNNQINQIQNQEMESKTETQETQQTETQETQQTETQVNLKPEVDNSPIKNGFIKGNQKFTLQGNALDIHAEADQMSRAYSDDYQNNEVEDSNVVKTPIDIARFANLSGEGIQALYKTKKMNELTKGFVPSDDDVKMINQDMEKMVKVRIGEDDLKSEYGDIINAFSGIALILGKSVIHRLKPSKQKDELLEYVDKKENEIRENFENQQVEETPKSKPKPTRKEIKKEIKEKSKPSEVKALCNNCNKKEIYENGLCDECFFMQLVENGKQEAEV
ncbi:hypothetical protein [Nitrosopumilus spindle-shaped virus]|uniref:Uncharacterized protein n=1 Tax=Nitrosopumilus spindle-shaped virus TaxID=2508184 RepID=A0A514K332_9VIRU|nr:hypothetical protein [Nitrosopumilus spindle-shaped virus]